MSLDGSSASRKSNCATRESETWSFISVPKNIIRSRRSLEYISNALSPLPDCSITVGRAELAEGLIFFDFLN